MRNTTIVGRALAKAMANGKFGAAEHAVALNEIIKAGGPDMADNVASIGNVSAIRQWGEKYGFVSRKEAQLDALAIAFEAAREEMAKAAGHAPSKS